jgi:protein TonB
MLTTLINQKPDYRMKKFSASIALLFCIFFCSAQTDTVKRINKLTDRDKTYTKMVRESYFPGGQRAWLSFLQDNLEYPAKAKRKNIQGTVVVQFIVNTDGTISDISAISGPEELKQAAINVIKKSPNWIPAFQKGKNVKSYKKQPVGFALQP